jgi:hypothetical protein
MLSRHRTDDSRLSRSRAALCTLLLVGCAALAAAAVGTPAVAQDEATGAEPTLAVTNASLAPGETATADVVLAGADGSVSGFELTVALDDGDVGRFANASYPAAFEVSSDPIDRRDGRALRLKAADLDGDIDADGPIRLATVRVAGEAAGRTATTIEDLQLDDAEGGAVTPAREAGILAVGDAGGAAASGGGGLAANGDGGATANGSGDPLPIGPAALALAALALAGGAVAVRRRS